MDKIRKDWQRKDDDYFLSTLKFHGFTPVQGEYNPRYKAPELLKLIDAEDIMSAVSIAAFSPSNDAFRLTFRTKEDLHHAVANPSTVMATEPDCHSPPSHLPGLMKPVKDYTSKVWS